MKRKVLPLILTIVVFVLDQLTKQLVMLNIPAYTIGASFFGDFLRIIHVYNPGIAFSMGNSLPDAARGMLFAVAPLVVLVVVLVWLVLLVVQTLLVVLVLRLVLVVVLVRLAVVLERLQRTRLSQRVVATSWQVLICGATPWLL